MTLPRLWAQTVGNGSATGVTTGGTPAPELPPEPASLSEILTSGGLPGLVILLGLLGLSIAAVYLVIDQVMVLRRRHLLPPGLAEQVASSLAASRVSEAERLLSERPSVLAGVIATGLARREFGWPEVEKAAEDALVDQSARLIRRIDYLSLIANLSPMVGLLGTVTGMIFAFRQVAVTRGAAGAGDLAEGIYQALVTTVGGLIVAIPALAASGILRNRVDEMLSEVTRQTERALSPLRRRAAARVTMNQAGGVPAVPPAQLTPKKTPPPSVGSTPPSATSPRSKTTSRSTREGASGDES